MVEKKRRFWIIIVVIAVGTLALAAAGLFFHDHRPPDIRLKLPAPFVGAAATIPVQVSDPQSGVRRIWIALRQGGHEQVLADDRFASRGLWRGGAVKQKTVQLNIAPATLGFADGKAVLRIAAWDHSLLGRLGRSRGYLEKEVTIDTHPPVIDVVTRTLNLAPGGAGLVIYRISEPCPRNGVQVGPDFFPGYGGLFKDALVRIAFVALGDRQGPDTPIFITAVDPAGNSGRGSLNYHIRSKTFKKDTIRITDAFLQRKLPEFSTAGLVPPAIAPVEAFVRINRELRKENYRRVEAICARTDRNLHWRGAFLRMPKSAPRAGFGDRRTYVYHGKVIDHEVHLGADLASVRQAPVPAANNGRVVYTGPLGIYGRTVILDHGFGLFSMYSHMSRIGVKTGQIVSRGETLGHTGHTGLAGGDHLHFAMIVHHIFVNPIEWWDAQWIRHNITDKIAYAHSLFRRGQPQ